MAKKLLLLAFLLVIRHATSAQKVVPTLTGTVDISVKKGTFTCDLVLADIPRLQDYYLRLNAGMNILYFKNVEANALLH
jgi:hypothetical protein